MRAVVAACLCCALIWASTGAAQSIAESNQRALSAYQAGDLQTARDLTRKTVELGQDRGLTEPAAYLEALNNQTFLATLGRLAPAEVVTRAEQALDFAVLSGQRRSAAGLTARLNLARATAVLGDSDASRRYRTEAVNEARATEWHGETLAAAVDLAFLNHDHTDLPAMIEEMIAVTKTYAAQTTLAQLYERQEQLEDRGDVDGVSALVDARILFVGAVQPELLPDFSHAALWQKFYMNHAAENFAQAAKALRAWAATGDLSPDEAAFLAAQAEASLRLAQLEGYSGQDTVQLGFTLLTLAFAELSYPPSDPRIGLALREKGAALGRLGEYGAANEALQEALLNLTLTQDGQGRVYLVLEDLAANAWQSGDLDQAERLFEQARRAYDTAVLNGAQPLSDYDLSLLALNRTRLFLDQGAYASAAHQFSQATDRFARFLDSGAAKPRDLWHHVLLAQTNALLLAPGADRDRAIAAVHATITAANTYYPKHHPRRAMALANAADQLSVSGDGETAQALLLQAHDISIAALPADAALTTEIEVKLALDALTRGNRAAAIGYLRRVTEARKSPQYRADLAAVSGDFERLAWLLLSQPDPDRASLDEALAALQWTHVSQSAEALAMMATRLTASDPKIAVLLKRRQDVLGDLALNRSALNSAYASGDNPAAILDRQRRLSRDAKAADIALTSAGLDLTGQVPITPLSLSQIQALLAPDEVLVTFLLPSLAAAAIPGLSGSSNRAIAIRQSGYLIAPVPEKSRGALNRSVDAFRCEMALSDTGCGARKTAALRGAMTLSGAVDHSLGFDWGVAHDLYDTLLGGVAPLLKPQDHLIIVPPSDLLRLPFQALITQPQPDFSLANADWLVRRHAVSVLPSFAALKVLKQQRPVESTVTKVLGVGDPELAAAPDLDCATFDLAALRAATIPTAPLYAPLRQDGVRLANVAELRKLSRLPDASCELRAIKAAFGAQQSQLLLQGDATEGQIKAMNASGALSRYDIIVFATHGVLAGETSAIAPGLVLTPPDRASALDDGLLTAAEVATLSLSARLVILSACNTAAGRDASQEGLSGLASGFFQAGARAAMVTHWAVFSAASAEITTKLATALAKEPSLSNAKALQATILSILEDPQRPLRAKHPSYWAAFAIVGL